MDPVSKAQLPANSEKTYKVGHCRPPKDTQFKPGQSGNPSGRPKKKPITLIFEELFEQDEDRESIKNRVRSTLTSKGMAGVLLLREAAERIEGKVTQPLDVTGHITDLSDEELKSRLTQLLSKS